jgi:hypothetical protein
LRCKHELVEITPNVLKCKWCGWIKKVDCDTPLKVRIHTPYHVSHATYAVDLSGVKTRFYVW